MIRTTYKDDNAQLTADDMLKLAHAADQLAAAYLDVGLVEDSQNAADNAAWYRKMAKKMLSTTSVVR